MHITLSKPLPFYFTLMSSKKKILGAEGKMHCLTMVHAIYIYNVINYYNSLKTLCLIVISRSAQSIQC